MKKIITGWMVSDWYAHPDDSRDFRGGVVKGFAISMLFQRKKDVRYLTEVKPTPVKIRFTIEEIK